MQGPIKQGRSGLDFGKDRRTLLPMTSAVIVAAGKGTRMGPGMDKLFLEVCGRPVMAHTWGVFDAVDAIDRLVIVVRDGMQSAFTEIAERWGYGKPYVLVPGGVERQDSVWNGLGALPQGCEVVAIHDGARPCVTERLILKTIEVARVVGAAVAAQRVVDTIKESAADGTIRRHLDRGSLWAVQTPQTFRVEVIRAAIAKARERGVVLTDDTAACELIGQAVRLVEGESANPKVTAPSDVGYVEALLASRE